jgi:hypothetical protein
MRNKRENLTFAGATLWLSNLMQDEKMGIFFIVIPKLVAFNNDDRDFI